MPQINEFSWFNLSLLLILSFFFSSSQVSFIGGLNLQSNMKFSPLYASLLV